MNSERILLVYDEGESKLRRNLESILEPHFRIDSTAQPDLLTDERLAAFYRTLNKVLQRFNPDLMILICLDASLKNKSRLLHSINERAFDIPIMLALESFQSDEVTGLLKIAAADFVVLPLNASEVLARAWKLLKASRGQANLQTVKPHLGFKELIGESPSFLSQLRRIPLVAKCEANVLISGETGTGKELYARAIHYSGPRAGRPFMPINCGAIPVELVENELFGHERGAFTSASTLQSGLIEEANGGTLFLDEIDCLPLSAQVKLLRFLQEKEYRPLGSAKVRRADVRIIAASNINLEEAVANGKMRQDLFYRLNIIPLLLPPLRERRQDIGLLARHFLDKYSAEFEKELKDFSDEALNLLMTHNWPGNVRELEHVIERSVVMTEGPIVIAGDLVLSCGAGNGHQESLQEAKAREIARFERNYIQGLLSACKGNITRAAQVARKNRRAFWQLIQKHDIDVAKFKPAR